MIIYLFKLLLVNCRSMALRRVRKVQVVWSPGPQRAAGRGHSGRGLELGLKLSCGLGVRGRRRRVAPPDAARTRGTQGLLTLALHALRQVSTEHSIYTQFTLRMQ